MSPRLDLAKSIVAQLTRSHAWLAVAESCTGGLIAHEITQVPGSSKVFYGGAVVYHPTLKTKFMHVPRFVIHKKGDVSEEVAKDLAWGALKLLQSQGSLIRPKSPLFGLSTTGFAGPAGGTKKVPIGTCWMALAMRKNKIWIKKVEAPLGLKRETYKALFAQEAFEMLHSALEKKS